MPKISIVIPTYNSGQYLAKAIDSVLSQTYRDFEIIVIDDGSTDNTKDMIMECAKKNPDKVRYFYQKKSGPSAARNKGIIETKGDYIAFLDADDLWCQNKLSLQMEYFEKNPEITLSATEFEFIDSEGKLLGYSNRREKIPTDGYILNYIFEHYLLTSTIMLKKEVFKKIGFFDETLQNAEDTDIQLRIATHFRIGLLEKRLVKYRQHDASLTRTKEVLRGKDRIRVIKNFLNKEKDFAENNKEAVRRMLSETCFDYVEELLALNRFKEAMTQLNVYLRYGFSSKSAGLIFKVILMNLLGDKFVNRLRKAKRGLCMDGASI